MSAEISREAARRFVAGSPWKNANTVVGTDTDGSVHLALYGKSVARRHNGVVEFNNQGYLSKTTKDRLNAVGVHYGVSIQQIKHTWYITTKDGREEMPANQWVVVSATPLAYMAKQLRD
jgi:hypothetical protein